ncbi:MAG: N-acetyltransferase [Chitinophagaceae bacterium]|nr:N-acetyltransferase [Chitinophagaceae bacterium]
MIEHLADKKRFEWKADGAISFIEYYQKGDCYILWHSQVPQSLRGQGIGKQLVEATFDYLLQHNIKAKATCKYIRMIAMRNSKWNSHIST